MAETIGIGANRRSGGMSTKGVAVLLIQIALGGALGILLVSLLLTFITVGTAAATRAVVNWIGPEHGYLVTIAAVLYLVWSGKKAK